MRTLAPTLDPPGPERTSALLARLAAGAPGERVSLSEIVAAMGDRAFALLLVVLALPNCVPMPPPIPLICGFLLLFIALEIVVGRPTPWLPARLLARSVEKSTIARALDRAGPALSRLETMTRPRLNLFDGAIARRLIGGVLLILSIGLLFAAPFVGQIPLGAGILLVGLGLAERDGLLVLGGVGVGSIGLVFSFGFIFAIVRTAMALLSA